MTRRQKLQALAVISVVLLISTVVFALTYLLTDAFYQTINQRPLPFVAHLINTVLGLLLCFLLLSLLGRIFGEQQRNMRMAIFGPIFVAMERMATGDFSVYVDNAYEDNPLINELTKSVNNMASQLNQHETMRQEFISNVSHEIQSPLTSIRGFARALQNDQLTPDDRQHYLDIIETESTRLSRITENLLKLATLESEPAAFAPKTYRLDRQIRGLILACEPQWMSKGIEMEVCLDEVETSADEDLLSQVWINLIYNSIKFTPTGGKIRIDLHQRDGKVEFKINDTGIGISEADQMHIFERFYKADKSRTHTNNGGSGLGLSIARKIVEMHSGTINVESATGGGATFTVSLPA